MASPIAPEKIVKKLSAVRKKKLKRLKAKIDSGTYRVDNWALVKAIFLSQ